MICMIVALFSCKTKTKKQGYQYRLRNIHLANGLTVVLNEDKSDPIAAVAIYYHVGSSREAEGKTGFAHLFEHMMFQKSENVGEDQFFKNIQGAGGTLNGSTTRTGPTIMKLFLKMHLKWHYGWNRTGWVILKILLQNLHL